MKSIEIVNKSMPVFYYHCIIETIVMLQACKNQVSILSEFKTDPSKSVEKHLEFRFDESRRIAVDVEVITADTIGWDIHCNTNEVCVWLGRSCDQLCENSPCLCIIDGSCKVM